MKICVVYPGYTPIKYEPSINAISDNYGSYPSLSLGYTAAIMEMAGHKIKFIDVAALGLSMEETLKEVKQFHPDLIAFTITTYLFHQSLAWINYIKENIPDVPILVGGVHVGIYPKEIFTHKSIDYGYMGESEIYLNKFIDALEKGKSLKGLNNIIYRNSNSTHITINNIGPVINDLNSTPFPARHLMPYDKYFSIISQRKNFTGLMSSRGCCHNCSFCEQGNQKFRYRTADSLLEEFKLCADKFKVREIDIFDSSFTIIKKRILEICDALKKEDLDIEWSARSRVDRVDKEMLKAMAEAKCKRIYYGVESGNQKILDKLRKDVTIQQIKDAIKNTKKAGINTFGYFMIGSPGDTHETVKQTIKFSKQLNLDYAQFNRVIPMTGTDMYKLYINEFKQDYWAKETVKEGSGGLLERPQTELTNEDVDKYAKKSYISFYFRPKYITKALLRIRSFEELKRNVKAGVDLLIKKEIKIE